MLKPKKRNPQKTRNSEKRGPKSRKPQHAPSTAPKGTSPGTVTVLVPFECIHEVHDKTKFQEADGRFLPALRIRPSPELQNRITNQEFLGDNFLLSLASAQFREWGDEVHVLRISHPQDPTKNVIRKLSDSFEDAKLLLQEELPQSLFGLWAAQFLREAERENYERLSRERNNCRDWIQKHYDAGTADRVMAGGE